jgi:hypothetical protein
MIQRLAFFTLTLVAASGIIGCREIGFRELPEAGSGGSRTEAYDLIQTIRQGLTAYKQRHGEYPTISETGLYDSIREYLERPIDPEYLYRNDKGRGYYLGLGGRANRIVYHYPGTIGPADYTLYWVGSNGVDEMGEGDDLVAWASSDTAVPVNFERRKVVDLESNGSKYYMRLITTGNDLYNDTAIFTITDGDTTLYRDRWPLFAYFDYRPELTDPDRKKIVRTELNKFFDQSQFVRTDSILEHNWRSWVTIDPKSVEALEIAKMNGLLFNYYAGSSGSKGVVYSPIKKKLIEFWKSDHKAQALMESGRRKK